MLNSHDSHGTPIMNAYVEHMIAHGFDEMFAKSTIDAWRRGDFQHWVPLEFLDPDIGWATVAEVLEDRDRFDHGELYSPLRERIEGQATGHFWAKDCAIRYFGETYYLKGEPEPRPRPGPKPKPNITKTVETISMIDVKEEPVEWLWKHYLARGKFQIIAGIMGDGKSQITLEFAKAISREGAKWTDNTIAPTGNVLIWSGEDNLEDTIKLRRPGYLPSSVSRKTERKGPSILRPIWMPLKKPLKRLVMFFSLSLIQWSPLAKAILIKVSRCGPPYNRFMTFPNASIAAFLACDWSIGGIDPHKLAAQSLCLWRTRAGRPTSVRCWLARRICWKSPANQPNKRNYRL
jgi:hypothetical protein